jgi:hypothetical protein
VTEEKNRLPDPGGMAVAVDVVGGVQDEQEVAAWTGTIAGGIIKEELRQAGLPARVAQQPARTRPCF